MSEKVVHGALVGAGLGVLIPLFFRPSIPMFGQPPIKAAIHTLFNQENPLDKAYGNEFWIVIFLCIALCATGGGLIVYLIEQNKTKTE
jgi:hypothetical protein